MARSRLTSLVEYALRDMFSNQRVDVLAIGLPEQALIDLVEKLNRFAEKEFGIKVKEVQVSDIELPLR